MRAKAEAAWPRSAQRAVSRRARLPRLSAQALAARAGNKDRQRRDQNRRRSAGAWCRAMRLRLRAALENLADNAVKFTHAGKRDVRGDAPSRRKQGRVRLVFTFADSGIGISAAELKHAVSSVRAGQRRDCAALWRRRAWPLASSNASRRRWAAISRVTSKKGSGSTFRLTVLVESRRSAATAPRQDRRPAPARPLSILCAEDNPVRPRGDEHDPRRTRPPRRFRRDRRGGGRGRSRRGGYDAVLMDVTLTGLNGIDAARRIRALPGQAGLTPVIGISGRGESGDEAGRARRRHEFLFREAGQPAKACAGAGGMPLQLEAQTLLAPLARSTIRTTSDMMRFNSKSFGV